MMTRFFRLGFALLIFLSLCYVTLWAYSYQWLQKEIDRVYAEAPQNGFEFLGPKPVVTGFPFVPEIYYGGGIKTGNTLLSFPESRLRGYPIPGLTFHVSVPRGIALEGIVDPSLWSLDTLEADLVIPHRIPGDYKPETLAAWQKSGGNFTIRNYKLTKGALQSTGKGSLSLDTDLQPVVDFESEIRGHELFVEALMKANIINPFGAAATTAVLNSLSKPDDVTGENVVTVSIGIKNQTLSVGPLQVARLPAIVWDTHMSPDLRQ